MSQKLIFAGPINSVSIGQVSYNILKELYNRNVQVIFFPKQFDLSAYNVSEDFKKWLEHSINSRYTKFSKDIPSLRVWHLNESEFKYSNKQYLFTFHETSSPTDDEINIVNQQEGTFFSSNWSVDNFTKYGANNVSFVPLGFDTDFHIQNRQHLSKDIINWTLIGKWEFRKNTEMIINTWVEKYGNNFKHQLTLCVTNPFFKPEYMNALIHNARKGGAIKNINPLQYLKTNAEINDVMNGCTIDLSGFSRSEGWGLPAFNSTCLGKWSIVTNCTAHKDWAAIENAIMVEPIGQVPALDNVFFHNQGPFNVGNFYDFKKEQLIKAMDTAEKLANVKNEKGIELQNKFTYKNTVDKILEKIL